MKHLVLVGDPVFDNAVYVGPGLGVISQLEPLLPKNWRVTLKVMDGATLAEMEPLLAQVPCDASHLVVSIGGNDVLAKVSILQENANSVADGLEKLTTIREQFHRNYEAMLAALPTGGIEIALCTIYDARFPDITLRRLAATALSMINDCITREAFRRGLTLIDLRLICDSDSDFFNPIEPSVEGGAKIARAVANFAVPNSKFRSRVIAR